MLGAVALRSDKETIEQVTQAFKWNCQSRTRIEVNHQSGAPGFDTHLQGQYLIYKTMQHYRNSTQRSNSLNQHQQTGGGQYIWDLQNIYGNVCL